MRIFIVITTSVICLIVTGCASSQKPDRRLSSEAYRRALASLAATPVPLPERTPYDSDPNGRGTYLDSYTEGYRTGLTGYYITPLFQAGPHHRERVGGYYAGLSAGWQVWSQRNLGPGVHFHGELPALAK